MIKKIYMKILNEISCKSFVGGALVLFILKKLGYEVGAKSKYEILEEDKTI